MNYRTIWRREEDGLTHQASVRGNEADGFKIRSDCGLVGDACWEGQLDEHAEITCPRCRTISGTKSPQPETETRRNENEVNSRNSSTENNSPAASLFRGADLIHVYSRKQALAEGVLIDVTATARQAGFRFPVALTAAVWQGYVRVPKGVEAQDEAGRLWDILWMLRWTIRQGNNHDSTIFFALLVRNDSHAPQTVRLKAVCGPDDDGSPCLTIMLSNED